MGFAEGIEKIKGNHSLLMLVCCAVPLVLVTALYFLGFSGYAFWLVILLCPLMHLLMMQNTGGHAHNSQQHQESKGDEKCH